MALETCADCSTRYAVGLKACPNCRSTERAVGASAAPPPIVSTSCTNTACAAVDVPRRVVLSRPVPGVVELPTLLCAGCGQVLPVAWPGPVESDGDAMSPKITRHGGASDRHDPEVAAAAETEPTPEAAAGQTEAEPGVDDEAEGGEESSPGSNSSTSTGKPSATSAKSKAAPRKRTGRASRSTPDPAESSSPDSPDTSGPATEPPTDDAEA